MYIVLLQDARLYTFLLQVDRDLADATRRSACRFCGGRLHSACYIRKPRGLPDGIDPGPAFPIRFSFCCRVDGCRRRHLPPSVRFLGPKVYLSVMVVLLMAMRQGPTPRNLRELRGTFGADRRTLARWRHWWKAIFPVSVFWQRCVESPSIELPFAIQRLSPQWNSWIWSMRHFRMPIGTLN